MNILQLIEDAIQHDRAIEPYRKKKRKKYPKPIPNRDHLAMDNYYDNWNRPELQYDMMWNHRTKQITKKHLRDNHNLKHVNEGPF